LVQKALNEGMLKFGDKSKLQMQVDVDPLKIVDAIYIEVVECNVVETIIDVINRLSIESKVDVVEYQMSKPLKAPKVLIKLFQSLNLLRN